MANSKEYSRKALLRAITKGLENLDYHETPVLTISGVFFFYKRVKDLLLTLEVQFSVHYQDRFTASFYLAPTFEHPGYLPKSPAWELAYKRIGHFLTPQERLLLLDPKECEPGIIDAWWIGYTPESVATFLEAVRLCEPRFLGQTGVFNAVHNSPEARAWLDMLRQVRELTDRLTTFPVSLRHQPKRYAKEIPPQWYWAAELSLSQRFEAKNISSTAVRRVAADAWRVTTLLEPA
jgi:hypothetical protein